MKLTGVEVPVDTLAKIEPNTVLMVISDEKGAVTVVKLDQDSIAENESLVRVASGCWVYIGGKRKWIDPCPY